MNPHYWWDVVTYLLGCGMNETAAEVGAAEGNFSRTLLLAGFRRVYLVDLWAHVPGMKGDLGKSDAAHDLTYQRCLANVGEFGDRAIILRGWSHEMAQQVPDESLDLVFIDATHEYKWVLSDLTHWYPKLKPGGVMLGHDYLTPEYTVRRAADEFAASVGKVCSILHADSIPDASFWFQK